MEVRERKPPAHCKPYSDVVTVGRIRPSIAVPQEIVGAYRIIVWTLRGCRNGERYLHESRLEDALRTNQRYPSLTKFESLGEDGPRENVSLDRDLLGKPVERRSSNPMVVLPVEVHDTVSTGTVYASGVYT